MDSRDGLIWREGEKRKKKKRKKKKKKSEID
jgi:hypothetical protein